MKTSFPLRQGSSVPVCFGVIFLAWLFCAPAFAAPRPPMWPPLPELVSVLYHESFDAPYWAGDSNTVVSVSGVGTLRESWSGYALERVGVVTPWVIAGLGDKGQVQVATDQGAVRFWFHPDWSSGGGPGAVVALAELAAVEGAQSAVVWSLRVCPSDQFMRLI